MYSVRRLIPLCLCLSFVLSLPVAFAGETGSGIVTSKLTGQVNPEQIQEAAARYAESYTGREAFLREAVTSQLVHDHFQKIIEREVTPFEKMNAFRQAMIRQSAKGTPVSLFRTEERKIETDGVNSQWGDISGYVTVNGRPVEATVVAFNEYGFYTDDGYASEWSDGYYDIIVPVGSYYIMTFTDGHIDEIYDDVPALFGSMENWRQATLVQVADGQIVENIDFDLQPGVTVTGTIYEADGVTPLDADYGFFFRIFWADRFENIALLPQYTSTDSGQYALTLPVTGSVKMFVETLDHKGEWYAGKTSWEEADPITLQAFGDTMTDIDFSLEELSAAGDGSVSGWILTGDGADTIDYAFIVAFDMADTSIAGFSLATDGSYTVAGLSDGEYVLYADDIPLTIFGQENRVGEYYQDAPTPSQATAVVIAGQNQVQGVNFTLSSGGGINGIVLGPDSQPLDSILVIALDADLLVWDDFLSNVQFGFAMTDGDGRYAIDGLPGGEYILRTLTPPPFYFDLVFDEINIPGTHYGRVVDEYYDGVQSILDFGNADRVTVAAPTVTTGIDFTLEAAGAISGSVRAADDTSYSPGGFIIAFDAETRLPQAVGIVDWDTYTLGPLPAGDFIIFDLALVLGLVKSSDAGDGILDDPASVYLSEFYDNARFFEDATPVTVVVGDTTRGIDFLIDLEAHLRGTVHVGPGYPAGADTLWGFPVIAYDAASGRMAGMSWTTFNGGYAFHTLAEGAYKVSALPAFYGYAVTYHGGGGTFDDPNSTAITVTAAGTFEADITLARADGSISGYVHDAETGLPVSSSMVIAYDQSGHVAGMGFSGYDWIAKAALDNSGGYVIPGLRSDQYSVRTWSLMSMMVYLVDMVTSAAGEFVSIADLVSLDAELDLAGHMFEDQWYGDVSIPIGDYGMIEMLNELMGLGASLGNGLSEIPMMLPTTYIDGFHGNQVTVTGPQETPGINFNLKPMDILGNLTGVEDAAENEAVVPDAFGLSQNYPNPFNPKTAISYQLSAVSGQYTTHTSLKVYNVMGQVVATLVDEPQGAGYYTVSWDAGDLSSGVYFYRLTAGDVSVTKRMVLVR